MSGLPLNAREKKIMKSEAFISWKMTYNTYIVYMEMTALFFGFISGMLGATLFMTDDFLLSVIAIPLITIGIGTLVAFVIYRIISSGDYKDTRYNVWNIRKEAY